MSGSSSKQLKKQGKGSKPNVAEALSDGEVSMHYVRKRATWSFKCWGSREYTLAPQNSPFWFARMRRASTDELGRRKTCQETDRSEYLEYTERQTKTRSGAEPRNIRTVKPKAFAAPNGWPERNPVFVCKFYPQKRPDLMLPSDAQLYLGINHTRSYIASSSNKS